MFKRKAPKKIKNVKQKKNTKRNKRIGWTHLNLNTKYAICLLFSALLFVIALFLVNESLKNVSSNMDVMGEKNEEVEDINNLVTSFMEEDIQVGEYMSFSNSDIMKQYTTKAEETNELLKELEFFYDDEEYQQLLNDIKSNHEELDAIFMNDITYAVDRGLKADIALGRKSYIDLRNETINKISRIQERLEGQKATAMSTVTAVLGNVKQTLFIFISISMILAFAFIFLLTRNVTKKLKQLVEINDTIANKNLIVEELNHNGNDEFGKLAASVNMMAKTLRGLVEEMLEASNRLHDQSNHLNDTSLSVQKENTQMSATMGELSVGAQQQASAASDIALFIDDLSKRIIKANEESRVLSKAAENLHAMSSEGNEVMLRSKENMQKIDEIVNQSVTKIKQLDEHSQEISTLIQVIDDISRQTNLLALNAAIEAARAGEAGRGFAVVADEISKLADEVGHSVTNIASIIQAIQQETKMVAKDLETSYREVEEGTKQIKLTENTFVSMNDEIVEIAQRAVNMDQALDAIEKNAKEITESVERIAAISEETAASIEQTTESAKQQEKAMDQLTQDAHQLNEVSKELDQVVSEFTI